MCPALQSFTTDFPQVKVQEIRGNQQRSNLGKVKQQLSFFSPTWKPLLYINHSKCLHIWVMSHQLQNISKVHSHFTMCQNVLLFQVKYFQCTNTLYFVSSSGTYEMFASLEHCECFQKHFVQIHIFNNTRFVLKTFFLT